MATATVLHLTDLHFGMEPLGGIAPTVIAQRTNTLDALLGELGRLDSQWRPDCVVISGDLGWAGRASDYEAAAAWIGRLLGQLQLTPDRLVVCPGNHDVDRGEAEVMARPQDPAGADHLLRVEKLAKIGRPFAAFDIFARDLGVPPFRINGHDSYLVGAREVGALRFVGFNSAWFCRGDDDRGHLFVGLPLVEVMEADGQLRRADPVACAFTIGLVHHPESWLNENETTAYGNRPATYTRLAKHVDILLSGHTHGGVAGPRWVDERTLVLVGGATYDSGQYRNNCSVLRIDTCTGTVDRRAYEYDPRDSEWRPRADATYTPRTAIARASGLRGSGRAAAGAALAQLRDRARRHAERYVAAKSRAIARTTALPPIARRRVGAHDPAERVGRANGALRLRADYNPVLLREAIGSERPTFLFGDLGSGKSTLIGQLVADLNTGNDDLLAVIVPARHFLDRPVPDVSAVLDAVTTYIRDQVAPDVPDFDLRAHLQQSQEITVAIDGFDEIPRAQAEALLGHAAEACELYSTFRVLASGRPVELQGLNYGAWQLLETLPLTRDELLEVLRHEAEADGLPDEPARQDARARLRALQHAPELLPLAETPLVIRLLRPQLGNSLAQRTLGDLLLNVLEERLTGWSQRDGREQARTAFTAALPDNPSREALLGRVAAAVRAAPTRTVTLLQLRTLIEEALLGIPHPPRAVADGVDLLRSAFFEGGDDELAFVSQPLFQCALALHVAQALGERAGLGLPGPAIGLWREVSFAAAALRRRGQLTRAVEPLQRYLDDVFDAEGDNATPAAAAVVGEAQDASLAARALGRFRDLGFRPLKYFGDRGAAPSSGYYARLVALAGDAGFEWLYTQYLDPRYPDSLRIYDLGKGVLGYWLALRGFRVDAEHAERLGRLAPPHLAAESSACRTLLPAVALAVPAAFTAEQRAGLLTVGLSDVVLRDAAEAELERLAAGADRPTVLEALEGALRQAPDAGGRDPHPALAVWRRLTDAAGAPPAAVVRALIASGSRDPDANECPALEAVVPAEQATALRRWHAIAGTPVAGHAALSLYRGGDRSFALLAPGLLAGAARYPGLDGCEEALDDLLAAHGRDGLVWLVNQFPAHDRHAGPDPALWRLLLGALERAAAPEQQALLYCVQRLGEFTLARNPDVRSALRRLLVAEPAYRVALRDALRSVDRERAVGAACVLLTCDPATEVRAAERVVRATTEAFQQQEWNRFAMRLALGAPVLAALRALAPSLLTTSRVFALGMLYFNGVTLTVEELQCVVDGVLGKAYWLDAREWNASPGASHLRDVLADPSVQPHLLQVVETEYGDRASHAAQALLEHHGTRLTADQAARAWLLAYRTPELIPGLGLENDLRARLTEVEFAGAFERQAAEIRHVVGTTSGSELLARTFRDPGGWRDLVWALLFERGLGGDLEGHFTTILVAGKRDAAVEAVIGDAARDFLGRATPFNRAALALLADEFGGLPELELTDAALAQAKDDMRAALLARLPAIPSDVRASGRATFLHPVPASEGRDVSVDQIRELTRDSDRVSGEALAFLEDVLLGAELALTDVAAVADASQLGALAANVMRYCASAPPNAEWLSRSFGIDVEWRQLAESQVVRLRRVTRDALVEQDAGRAAYVAALRADLARDASETGQSLWRSETVLLELLRFAGSLDGAEWARLIEQTLASSYRIQTDLLVEVAAALVDENGENRGGILDALRRAGEGLCAAEPRYGGAHEGGALLLSSLGLLLLEDEVTPLAVRLFLLALPRLMVLDASQFTQGRPLQTAVLAGADVLSALDPLLGRVPGERIHRCIEAGLTSDLPAVRSCCRVLVTLAGEGAMLRHASTPDAQAAQA